MKIGLLMILSVLLASCIKDGNKGPGAAYVDLNGTSLILLNAQWISSTKSYSEGGGFWFLSLVLSGSTNADKVTVETYGDGVIGEQNISLDSQKYFSNDTIGISFSHYSTTPPSGEFSMSTTIKACKGLDTLKVTLNSGNLKY